MFRSFMFVIFLALSPGIFAADAINTVTLGVQGMTCAACPITVKTALKRVPGVSDVKVDYKTGIAEVSYDPKKTSPDELAKAITSVGFPTSVRGVH
ncbi:MAG TPA: cation transporter [Burkholderiales bacterium]|jgi:mercuric ion binding protein|nr:cation transporter [Burkholderiales bacterium]